MKFWANFQPNKEQYGEAVSPSFRQRTEVVIPPSKQLTTKQRII